MKKKFLILALGLAVSVGYSTAHAAQIVEAPCHQYPRVKVENGKLMVHNGICGYDEFWARGTGYAPYPVGTFSSQYGMCVYIPGENSRYVCNNNIFDDSPGALDRDLPLIKEMNANVIRTWDKVTANLLSKSDENGLKVIAGYPIAPDLDFTNSYLQDAIIADFVTYVNEFKNDEAILLWAIGSENNFHFCSCVPQCDPCDPNQQARAYYSLVNRMAEAARNAEGQSFYHPVALVFGEIGDIGNADLGADDASLPFIDIHGVNAFRGASFGDLFTQFRSKSTKPLLVTEFGTDTWFTIDPENPEDGIETQNLQAQYMVSAWDEIANDILNRGPSIGGITFSYSDHWWGDEGAWNPSCATHAFCQKFLLILSLIPTNS